MRIAGRGWIVVAVAALALFVAGASVKMLTTSPEFRPPTVATVMPAASGGTVCPEPLGAWVTSTWPTTRYYTERRRAEVWGEWAPGNRIWFETESALLAAYPGRQKR